MTFLYLWAKTLRIKANISTVEHIKKNASPLIFLFWHNCLFSAPFVYKKYFKDRKMAGLVSSSKDGAWLVGIFNNLNIFPIRGSSSFRGAQALKEAMKVLENNYDISITPDGPRGPIYSLAKGALHLAEKTQVPICLVTWEHSHAWKLKSWDTFFIPKPFSKIKVQFHFFDNLTQLIQTQADQNLEHAVKQILKPTQ